MKGYKKLDRIEEVIRAFKEDLCPYCYMGLTFFYHLDLVVKGCGECDRKIIDANYINAIENIMRF